MVKTTGQEEKDTQESTRSPLFPPPLVRPLADEIAKTVVMRLPQLLKRTTRRKSSTKSQKKLEHGVFLDTSAIIDGRIFDVLELRIIDRPIVIIESILLELKHIADLQDTVKRERGRNGLNGLDKLKKTKAVKVMVLSEANGGKNPFATIKEVDEKLIAMAKANKGRIITCDYNLAKKATIQNVPTINMNELANVLKVRAVPGEALHIKVLHPGKDTTQGVGYLDDGTMIVVEHASSEVGKTIDAVVSRIIQTSAGRILFAKKI